MNEEDAKLITEEEVNELVAESMNHYVKEGDGNGTSDFISDIKHFDELPQLEFFMKGNSMTSATIKIHMIHNIERDISVELIHSEAFIHATETIEPEE